MITRVHISHLCYSGRNRLSRSSVKSLTNLYRAYYIISKNASEKIGCGGCWWKQLLLPQLCLQTAGAPLEGGHWEMQQHFPSCPWKIRGGNLISIEWGIPLLTNMFATGRKQSFIFLLIYNKTCNWRTNFSLDNDWSCFVTTNIKEIPSWSLFFFSICHRNIIGTSAQTHFI